MLSIGLNALGQVVKTAAFGAITGKVVDSLVSSKINKKTEHNKWIRDTKLEFFTKLSQEILSYDLSSSSAEEERKLKEICSKTILIIDNKNLILKVENYISELNKTKRALLFGNNTELLMRDFKDLGLDLLLALNNNLKKA